jgi:hypothetical protein
MMTQKSFVALQVAAMPGFLVWRYLFNYRETKNSFDAPPENYQTKSYSKSLADDVRLRPRTPQSFSMPPIVMDGFSASHGSVLVLLSVT